MIRVIPQLCAVALVAIEVEPQRQVNVRLGDLHLNLYAMEEALTQSIMLTVMNKLMEMMTRGLPPFGMGEVVVGAGVRVLFAAGVQLQGFDDFWEFIGWTPHIGRGNPYDGV